MQKTFLPAKRGALEAAAYLVNYGADPYIGEISIGSIVNRSSAALKLIYETLDENKKFAFVNLLNKYLSAHFDASNITGFFTTIDKADIEQGQKFSFNTDLLAPHQMQNQSTTMLRSLIADNNLYIQSKNNQPLSSRSAKLKARAFMGLAWMTIIGLDVFLFAEFATSRRAKDKGKFLVAGITVSVMGLILVDV